MIFLTNYNSEKSSKKPEQSGVPHGKAVFSVVEGEPSL